MNSAERTECFDVLLHKVRGSHDAFLYEVGVLGLLKSHPETRHFMIIQPLWITGANGRSEPKFLIVGEDGWRQKPPTSSLVRLVTCYEFLPVSLCCLSSTQQHHAQALRDAWLVEHCAPHVSSIAPRHTVQPPPTSDSDSNNEDSYDLDSSPATPSISQRSLRSQGKKQKDRKARSTRPPKQKKVGAKEKKKPKTYDVDDMDTDKPVEFFPNSEPHDEARNAPTVSRPQVAESSYYTNNVICFVYLYF